MADATLKSLPINGARATNPLGGYIQKVAMNGIEQDVIVFNKLRDDGVIWDTTLGTGYTATTGLKLVVGFSAESPIVAGNVVLDFAAQGYAANDPVNVDAWGTAAASSATAVSTTPTGLKYITMALVKANVGNGEPAAQERIRIRLRRTGFSAATDTVDGDIYIHSVELVDY